MRRRVLTTTKILSVAVAVLPACDRAAPVHADPATTTAPSASAVVSAAPSADTGAPDPKLLVLASELLSADRAKVLAGVEHYRPLCDAQGYPLVGNLQTKQHDPSGMLVSELCAEVRKKQQP